MLLLLVTYTAQMLIFLSLLYLLLIPVSVRRYLAFQRADQKAAEAALPAANGPEATGDDASKSA